MAISQLCVQLCDPDSGVAKVACQALLQTEALQEDKGGQKSEVNTLHDQAQTIQRSFWQFRE